MSTVITGGGGDYTNLNAALSGESSTTGSLAITCSGGADNYRITQGAMAASDIDIYPASGQEHGGSWNTSVYRIEINSSWQGAAYSFSDTNNTPTVVRGLQIANISTDTGGGRMAFYVDQAGLTVKNCIIKLADTTVASGDSGFYIGGVDINIYGNLIYNFDDGIYIGNIGENKTINILGNGVFKSVTHGLTFSGYPTTAGPVTVRNNIFEKYSGNDYTTDYANVVHSYNICSDATGPDGAYNSTTLTYVNDTSFDWHLATGDGTVGADLSASYTTDLDGNTIVNDYIGPFDTEVSSGTAFTGSAVLDALLLYEKNSQVATGFGDISSKEFLAIDERQTGAAQDVDGITSNDTWTEPVSIELVQDVSVGTLVLELNGLFTYTPPPTFVGYVTFQYRLWELGIPSNVGTVTITVEGSFIDTAVFEPVSVSGNIATLIAGYIGQASKDPSSLKSLPGILISSSSVPFIGSAVREAFALSDHSSAVAAGFSNVAIHDLVIANEKNTSFVLGFNSTAARETLNLSDHASVLLFATTISFIGMSKNDTLPIIEHVTQIKTGFSGQAVKEKLHVIDVSTLLAAGWVIQATPELLRIAENASTSDLENIIINYIDKTITFVTTIETDLTFN